MARLVELLEKVGPNLNEIARVSGQNKETVRYRYREKILKKGFGLQARPNYERFGLKRVMILTDLGGEYLRQTPQLFKRLNETAYIASYHRTLIGGRSVVSASVPAEFVGEFGEFFRELQKRGIFGDAKMVILDWFRSMGMNAEYYDFDEDRWELDWERIRGSSPGMGYLPSARGEFDYSDLLLLKELQVDATKSLTDIAEKLHVNYKRLLRHYARLFELNLVHGYRTSWIRTRYDPGLDHFMKSKHRYIGLDVLASNLTPAESLELMTEVRKIPFLWAEAGGRHYYAQLVIPLEYIPEVLQHLRLSVEGIKDRVSFDLGDQDGALAFTISYQLYDEASRKWTFNPAKALEEVERIVPAQAQRATRKVGQPAMTWE